MNDIIVIKFLHCKILFKSCLLLVLVCLCDFSFGALFDQGVL